MKIGFIGLGRMGHGMVLLLLKNKHEVVVYNRTSDKVEEMAKKGAIPAFSVEDLAKQLSGKKIIWLMLPAGKVTDEMIKRLLPLLEKGDIIIDGANDFYKNAETHSVKCMKKGVYFFDCGVSGGIHGLEKGYTLMVGGQESQFKYIEPLCRALSPEKGYGYFGESGSGHFVKSVHNIIEYVYLQGLAEGIELLSKYKHPIQLDKATSVWQPASVINSWLLDLTTQALQRKDFDKLSSEIGSVTIDELKKTKKSVDGFTPAFDAAVKIREDKSDKFILGKRTIAAVRREFGGHEVKTK